MSPNGVHVMHPDEVWINGRWVAAHSGRTIELICPKLSLPCTVDKLSISRFGSRAGAAAAPGCEPVACFKALRYALPSFISSVITILR